MNKILNDWKINAHINCEKILPKKKQTVLWSIGRNICKQERSEREWLQKLFDSKYEIIMLKAFIFCWSVTKKVDLLQRTSQPFPYNEFTHSSFPPKNLLIQLLMQLKSKQALLSWTTFQLTQHNSKKIFMYILIRKVFHFAKKNNLFPLILHSKTSNPKYLNQRV